MNRLSQYPGHHLVASAQQLPPIRFQRQPGECEVVANPLQDTSTLTGRSAQLLPEVVGTLLILLQLAVAQHAFEQPAQRASLGTAGCVEQHDQIPPAEWSGLLFEQPGQSFCVQLQIGPLSGPWPALISGGFGLV